VERSREGWIVADHNTVLIGRTGIVLAGPSQGRTSAAVRVISTACVFAPAPGGGADGAAVLRHPEGMQPGRLFDWWENRNGYAPAIKVFRISGAAEGSAPPQDFRRDWVGYWEAGRVESPHLGVNGVLMAMVLTSLGNLTPPDVALSRSCTGATGAPDGSAIGIRTSAVGPLGRVASPATGPSSPQTPANRQNPANRPDF
jgi:hypothetical protein